LAPVEPLDTWNWTPPAGNDPDTRRMRALTMLCVPLKSWGVGRLICGSMYCLKPVNVTVTWSEPGFGSPSVLDHCERRRDAPVQADARVRIRRGAPVEIVGVDVVAERPRLHVGVEGVREAGRDRAPPPPPPRTGRPTPPSVVLALSPQPTFEDTTPLITALTTPATNNQRMLENFMTNLLVNFVCASALHTRIPTVSNLRYSC
jgi:hypothetical protein